MYIYAGVVVKKNNPKATHLKKTIKPTKKPALYFSFEKSVKK